MNPPDLTASCLTHSSGFRSVPPRIGLLCLSITRHHILECESSCHPSEITAEKPRRCVEAPDRRVTESSHQVARSLVAKSTDRSIATCFAISPRCRLATPPSHHCVEMLNPRDAVHLPHAIATTIVLSGDGGIGSVYFVTKERSSTYFWAMKQR